MFRVQLFVLAFLVTVDLFARTSPQCVIYLSDLAYKKWAGGSYTLNDVERVFHRKFRNDPTFATWIYAQKELSETPEQLLTRFENENPKLDSMVPASWDLTNYGKNLAPITDDTRPMHGMRYYLEQARRFVPLWRTIPKRSPYDEAVLSLRKGDTVEFGAHKFVLGDFLGSGNSTFVFRLEGQPGKVIRIPFLVAPLKGVGFHPEIFNMLTRWRQKDPNIPQVKIYQSEYGFSIVSEVDGNENGNEFLISVRRKYMNNMSPDMQRFFTELSEQNLSWATVHWYLAVEKLALQENDLETFNRLRLLRTRANQYQNNALLLHILEYTRQFVWDRTKRDWILVDWE